MGTIKSTTNIIDYDYVVNAIDKKGASLQYYVSNNLVNPTAEFLKSCSVNEIDIGDSLTITYTIKNTSVCYKNCPAFTTIEVVDPLLIDSYVSITSSSNVLGSVDLTDGSFLIDLTSLGGSLSPDKTISAKITITVKQNDSGLAIDELDTTSTATLQVTPDSIPVVLNSKANLKVKYAKLILTKSATPNNTVTPGELIKYTIMIENIGTVDAIIKAGNFLDTIPPETTFVNIIHGSDIFSYSENRINNHNDLIVPSNTSASLIFAVSVNPMTS